MDKQKRLLPTVPEMAGALSEAKGKNGYTSRIYKAQADLHKGEQLAADLDRKLVALRQTGAPNRIPWDDFPYIRERCLAYLEACRDAQTIPTVSGLAVFGLGATRQALNGYLRQHPNTQTAVFIQQLKDLFSDILETQALMRNLDTVMSIFVLKNDHDRSDRVEIHAETDSATMGELADRTELEARLADIVID